MWTILAWFVGGTVIDKQPIGTLPSDAWYIIAALIGAILGDLLLMPLIAHLIEKWIPNQEEVIGTVGDIVNSILSGIIGLIIGGTVGLFIGAVIGPVISGIIRKILKKWKPDKRTSAIVGGIVGITAGITLAILGLSKLFVPFPNNLFLNLPTGGVMTAIITAWLISQLLIDPLRRQVMTDQAMKDLDPPQIKARQR